MFAQLSRIFRPDHRLAEIASLDARALDEIGLSRTDLARVATAPQAVTDRMEAMAARHGVAADRLAGHAPDLAGMIESCRSCDWVGACRAFLSDPSPGASQAVFCPNHTTYEALCAAQA
jgi:hypothetical protein